VTIDGFTSPVALRQTGRVRRTTTYGPAAVIAQWALPVIAALVVVPFVKPGGTLWPWRPSMVDLDVYRYTGEVLLNGGDILTARTPGDWLAFIYPPFAALLCVPLVVVPHTLLQILTTAANALAVQAVLYRLGWYGWRLGLASTGCVLLVEPVRETIGFGQINILLMLLVVVSLVPGPRLLPGRAVTPPGALVGLAAAIKVTPALFAVHLLFAREWRKTCAVVLTAAGLTLIGFLALPAETIGFVRLLLAGETRTGPAHFLFNQSILAGVLRVFGETDANRYLGLAISAVVAVVGAYAAALWHRRGEVLLAVSLCGTATLLASPLSWTHHFVWVVPLGVALLQGKDLPRALRLVGGVFVVWVSAALYKRMPWGSGVELTYNGLQQLISVVSPVLGILVLVVAIVTAQRWTRPEMTTGPWSFRFSQVNSPGRT